MRRYVSARTVPASRPNFRVSADILLASPREDVPTGRIQPGRCPPWSHPIAHPITQGRRRPIATGNGALGINRTESDRDIRSVEMVFIFYLTKLQARTFPFVRWHDNR